ncbi:M48 family metallopeptidase [Bacillus badius]|uniref:Ankyrin repeat protein n=1 Tax=Bacillus badius TaxID=1455 RepID=A0ABR5AU51_BACBA|nr:M48 family metallopeptidase [Bacillus badius]KIL77703.1 Ankyrin repeat protein [Bacillus badius]MED4715783.1 M48 family metallopeptidase [Bacillus badius]
MNQEIPLQSLVHKNEKKYFWLVLIISLVTYVGLIASIIGIFIILGLFALSLFLHALSLGHIRANAVKLTENQFPEVYGQVKKLSEAMEIKQVPDVYVMESQGILNAFATRFFGRNMVVLYSEIFELAHHEAKDELTFVIAHELAHIKRNHLTKMMFILPAMWIPGIAELYLRACEYTCDRYAAYYINNREAAKRSLTILAVGKELYQQVNRAEYLDQMNKEKGFFVWLSEMLSTHPPLPKRINEIAVFFGEPEQTVIEKKTSKLIWLWVPTTAAIFALFVAAGVYAFEKIAEWTAGEGYEEYEDYGEEEGTAEPIPPIIEAAVAGNTEKVAAFIEKDEDVHAIDNQGYTPLHWAVLDNNPKMVELLLKAGANPNEEDYYGMTPLAKAAEQGNAEMVKRLGRAGGDPNYQSKEAETTPLFYAVLSEDPATVSALLELGADAEHKDSENITILMHAIETGNRHIIESLKKASE